MAETIEMPFRVWTRMGPRKHVLDGMHIGATWRIPMDRPCAAAVQPFVKLLSLTTCFMVKMKFFKQVFTIVIRQALS